MEPGRELDALVAERIFGYALDYEFADTLGAPTVAALRDQYDEWGMLPNYSTDVADAWSIVEYMRINILGYCAVRFETTGVGYMVAFYSHSQRLDRPGAFSHGDTIPMAICLAALKAHGVD